MHPGSRSPYRSQVRIGASTTALIYHLPPVLTRLRRQYPNIELVVTTGTTTGVVERILRNEIEKSNKLRAAQVKK